VTHQLGRGKKWPPELFAPGGRPGSGSGGGRILVGAADAPEARLDLLAEGLRLAAEGAGAGGEDGAESAFVYCPDAPAAHRVAAGLAARGFALTDEPGEPGVLVAWGEEETSGGAAALVGLPTGLADLTTRLGAASARMAVVSPAELAQLRLLARRAGWEVSAIPEGAPTDARDAIGRFRDRVRRRLEASDDAAELLVLEPLLREHGAARVAAALSGLLRRALAGGEAAPGAEPGAGAVGAAQGPGTGAPSPGRTARAGGSGGRDRSSSPRRRAEERGGEPGTRGTWFRLYVSAGSRDGVGPNDIVGAITGETGAVGAQIGRIDVRSSYTLVDVDSQIAEEVMARLSGATIKGRQVEVRPDRET